MKIKAYAKINLYLKVRARRPDGFHEIETLMRTIGLYDELVLTMAKKGIKLSCTDHSLPLGPANLVYRAARAMEQEALVLGRTTAGIRIHLKKNIPVGAGLGGGSSDAASTLLALNRLWRLRLKRAQLAAIGAKLGSDVPFFIYGGAAVARGRGEKLRPVKGLPNWRLVLVKPPFGVSTRWAYENLKLNLTKTPKNSKIIFYKLRKNHPKNLAQGVFNDLESVCGQKHPLLLRIKRDLLALGALAALMSGSGSTVFAIVPNRQVEHSIREVWKRKKGYWLWSGSTIKT